MSATNRWTRTIALGSARRAVSVIGAWAVLIVAGAVAWGSVDIQPVATTTLLGDLPSLIGEEIVRTRIDSDLASTATIVCARRLANDEVLDRWAARSEEDAGVVQTLLSAAPQCAESAVPAVGAATGAESVQAVISGESLVEVQLDGTPKQIAVRAYGSAMRAMENREGQTKAGEGGAPAPPAERVEQTVIEDIGRAEAIALPFSLIVLCIILRAVVAPLLPLVLGFATVAVTLGLTAGVARLMPVPFYAYSVVSMVGLAVGIDYALLMVARFREELDRGAGRDTALAVAGARAGGALVISGGTVVVGLVGMAIAPLPLFRVIALGASASVIIGVAAALTLLPAMLRVLGPSLLWTPFRRPIRCSTLGWRHSLVAAYLRFVTRAAPFVLGLATVVLIVLGAKSFDVRYGLDLMEFNGISNRSETSAAPTVQDELVAMLEAVIEIVVVGDRSSELEAGLGRLIDALGVDPGVTPALVVQWNASNDVAVVTGVLTDPPESAAEHSTLTRLRDEVIPMSFTGVPAEATLTGPATIRSEIVDALAAGQIRVVATVLCLTFFLFLLAFRSLVAPLIAIVFNLLSVTASLGLLVLVMQDGVGRRFFGFQPAESIGAWVPIVLFGIHFGLTMDYHIFMLSRIKEHLDSGASATDAITAGCRGSVGVVGGAVLIMVAVFAGFATGRLAILQQLGFGLAVAVILDAVVVRAILVPASLTLLGRWHWYLPAWLAWLPSLNLDERACHESYGPNAITGGTIAPAAPPPHGMVN